MVAHHDSVTLCDHIFNHHSQVWNLLERCADVLNRARRSRRHSRRDVGSVIYEFGCEIHFADSQILPVLELLEMIAPNSFISACVMSVFGFLSSPECTDALILDLRFQADAA